MAAIDFSVERERKSARLLAVYAEASLAIPLIQRLPQEKYDLISSPLSALSDRWLEELRPDIILCLPPNEPEELIATCEALRSSTELPIVLLSRRSQETIITRAFAAGIDEYWSLPIGEKELAARLNAMLRRLQRYSGPREVVQVGRLVLSSADRSVELDRRRIFLSPIEFRLLAQLASAPGKVFTHDILMARVWGAEYVDSRNYLHLYIRYLREKIEEEPADPKMILSEWGVGYKLQPPA